jgi:hypothetical protein
MFQGISSGCTLIHAEKVGYACQDYSFFTFIRLLALFSGMDHYKSTNRER